MTVDEDEDEDINGDINRSVLSSGDVKLKSKSKSQKRKSTELQKKSKLMYRDKQSNDVLTVESNVKPVVYVRSQVIKLTSCYPSTISQSIERTFGAVPRIECRGTSLKVTCTSDHQKNQILHASSSVTLTS